MSKCSVVYRHGLGVVSLKGIKILIQMFLSQTGAIRVAIAGFGLLCKGAQDLAQREG